MKAQITPKVAPAPRDVGALWELALIFLKLGTTAFGGPAAHLAMMRTEFVERRQWLTESEFLDLIGASNLIPGPGSTEVAIFIGQRRAGVWGLLLAGLFFILPAALIVGGIAWAYVRFGQLPQTQGALYGIKPVIIAVVGQALWNLGRTAFKSWHLAVIAAIVLVLALVGMPPLALLFGAGTLTALRAWNSKLGRPARPLATLGAAMAALLALPLLLSLASNYLLLAGPSAAKLPAIFLVFLKMGAVVYGSGYVLLAFLQADLVNHFHWLTQAQLFDSIAVGQFTPGPVFTTATFIGYLLAGPRGAFVATVAMFLPAFLLVAAVGPHVPRLRQFPLAASFLDGVNLAAVSLMASVTLQLAQAALVDLWTFAIAAVAAYALFRWRVNSAWLVLAGAVLGLAFHVLG